MPESAGHCMMPFIPQSHADQPRRWRAPFMVGLLTMTCGCATAPAPPAAEVRQGLGAVAIAPAQYTPQSNFSTYATGKSAGAARGAAEGDPSSQLQLNHDYRFVTPP